MRRFLPILLTALVLLGLIVAYDWNRHYLFGLQTALCGVIGGFALAVIGFLFNTGVMVYEKVSEASSPRLRAWAWGIFGVGILLAGFSYLVWVLAGRHWFP
ncbi:MAG: hypothetical protein AB1331_00310 [Bacillota bacterium]